jgi:DNA-binding CsgD family transcriptional regulator
MTRRRIGELSHEALCVAASQAPSRSEFRAEVLERLCQLEGVEAACYQDSGQRTEIDGSTLRYVDAGYIRRIHTAWDWFSREMAPVLSVLPTRRAVLDADEFGDKGIERTEVYNQIMRPHGWKAAIYVAPQLNARQKPALIGLALDRGGLKYDRKHLPLLRELTLTLALADAALDRSQEPSAGLLPAERDLAQYVSNGFTNRQIATALGLSVFTVRNQLSRLFEKYDLGSRAELAHRFGRDLK